MDKRRTLKKTAQPRSMPKAAREASLPVARSLENKLLRPPGAKPVGQAAEPFFRTGMAPQTSGRRGKRGSRGVGVIAAGGVVGVLLVVVLVIANLGNDDGASESGDPIAASAQTSSSESRRTQHDPKKTFSNIAANNRQAGSRGILDDAAVDNANVDDGIVDNTASPENRPADPSLSPRRTVPFPNLGEATNAGIVAIRQSLSRRDMAAARQQLEQLQQSANDVEQTTQLARVRTVYQHIANFWTLAITTARQTRLGAQFQYADSKYVVTSVDPTAIGIREGRINKHYTFASAVKNMPTELAMALCGPKLIHGDPQIMLYAGTFLAVDQNGSLQRARMLCAQAAQQGVDCEAVLPELGFDNLDSLVVVDRRELSALFAAAAPAVQNPTKPAAQTVDARLPVPSHNAQKHSLEKIRSVFESEYAAAKSIDAQIALASKLFEQAKATQSDAAARWVLLTEARRLTTTAGDVPLLMLIVAMQAEHYRVDLLKETADALQQLPSKAQPLRLKSISKRMAVARSIVRQMLSTADEAIAADEYEIASQLSRLAATLARKVKDSSLSRMASAGQKEVRELQRQWQTADKARQTLEKNSTDPQANYRLGRYLCLIKGNWDEGLPLLAKGSSTGLSAALRRVAKADLTHPTRTDHQVKLADAWWSLAKTAGPREKAHLSRRARGWYAEALEKIVDLDKVAVEKRLKEIDVVLAQADIGETESGGKQLIVPLGSGVTMRFQLMPKGNLPPGTRTKPTTIDRAFFIAVTEVTQAQWQAVMGNNPNRSKSGPRLPVTRISWDDCNQFIEKLNAMGRGKYHFQMPTESQWEYACRAGTTTTYFFGNDPSQLSQYAWYKNNANGTKRPVALLKPNPAGLYDITGNVWEWCQGGIIRGGCHTKPAEECKWKSRADYSTKTAAHSVIGLRLVCDP